MDLIADTSLLVGLWRKQKWATDFASDRRSSILGIPWVALGEFWHGAVRARHDEDEVARFLGLGIHLVEPHEVVKVYGEVSARLQESEISAYRSIGQNDLWIAAVAIRYGRPLVSRNLRHFGKIGGLEVIVPGGDL